MQNPPNSAGRIPFFVENGKIVFGLVAETNRIIDKEYIRQKCGKNAANLVPDPMMAYGLPRGTIEPGETAMYTAAREAAEEIGYNPTGEIIRDEHGKEIPPHGGPITQYLQETVEVQGKRGAYQLTLYVDRIEPYSFALKPMETKTDEKVRRGNIFQEGGKWGTVADLTASLEVFRSLARHSEIVAVTEVHKLIRDQIKSMESQITAMTQIEEDLITILQKQGELVNKSVSSTGMTPDRTSFTHGFTSEHKDELHGCGTLLHKFVQGVSNVIEGITSHLPSSNRDRNQRKDASRRT
ncbi:MAG TPA: NUDIX hydrolase [Ktedonobacteraceae bacterium]|nr:NUDIX hydrolase [Ktedonobacteraceae bacterium]